MALTQVKTTGIADDAVTEAKVANDAIGITEMKAGTDGHVITYDASGNPTTVGPGTDGQVLTSTGAGSPPAFEDAVSEGTQVKSTGESGGTKFLREDGDGTCSWQAVPAAGISDVVSDTSPQLGGNLASNGNNILLADDDFLAAGTGTDMKIHHTGGQNYVEVIGDGNLNLKGAGSVVIKTATSKDAVVCNSGGSTDLYHDNVKKLETMTNGIRVQGGIMFGSDTADANVLDDYEEGTFDNQNVLNGWGYLGSGSDANAAPTMTYNGGHYVKIGSMVYVHMRIAIGNYNSAQGTLVFGTMPFYADRGGTESLLEQHLGCWMNACSSGGEDVYAHTYGSSKYYYGIGKRSSSGHSDFTGPNGGSGLDISINGWYRIE